MAEKSKRILVVFAQADVTHRAMLTGILRYAHLRHGSDWQIQLDLRDIYRRSSQEVADGGFSGIIAAVGFHADRNRYFRTGLPTVLFEPTLTHPGQYPRPDNNVTFVNDHDAEGRTAAEYFLRRKYRNFAFVGTPRPTAWSEARQRGFSERLGQAGIEVRVFNPEESLREPLAGELPRLVRWLKSLPPHCAILAAHDERALRVIAAAAKAGRAIPGDIAILGVDDDELLCTTTFPTLSSIPVNAEDTGRCMATALDDLFCGRSVERTVQTSHTRVITRLSTDAFAQGDPIVTKAVGYIRSHLGEPLPVTALAAAANCSRRTLEMRFADVRRESPAELVSRLRREEALKLLRETRLPIAEIGRRCGYMSPAHFSARIKRHCHLTPRELRASEPPLQ